MIVENALALDLTTGQLGGSGLTTTTKTLADVAAIYSDVTGYDLALPTYEVRSYIRGDADLEGNLYVGTTTIWPLYFHGELNMTRGHFHARRDQAEVYLGLAGSGLLLLGALDGRWWVEEVSPGSIHHISGDTAHRLVNTGTEVLQVFAVWPSVAGHDYDAISPTTFGVRVLRDGTTGYRLEEVAR